MIFNSLLGKLFRIRENSAQRNRGLGADEGFDGAEMPFLDHLEDLRKMLTPLNLVVQVQVVEQVQLFLGQVQDLYLH